MDVDVDVITNEIFMHASFPRLQDKGPKTPPQSPNPQLACTSKVAGFLDSLIL